MRSGSGWNMVRDGRTVAAMGPEKAEIAAVETVSGTSGVSTQ